MDNECDRDPSPGRDFLCQARLALYSRFVASIFNRLRAPSFFHLLVDTICVSMNVDDYTGKYS